MSASAANSPRLTVMVAEDEFLVACDLAETVEVAGYGVDGPFATVATAHEAMTETTPDCAVLDIHLHDDDVFSLADRLQAADVPIIFHSGHAQEADLRNRYPDAQICSKPCPPADLLETIQSSVANRQAD